MAGTAGMVDSRPVFVCFVWKYRSLSVFLFIYFLFHFTDQTAHPPLLLPAATQHSKDRSGLRVRLIPARSGAKTLQRGNPGVAWPSATHDRPGWARMGPARRWASDMTGLARRRPLPEIT